MFVQVLCKCCSSVHSKLLYLNYVLFSFSPPATVVFLRCLCFTAAHALIAQLWNILISTLGFTAGLVNYKWIVYVKI